MKQTGSKQVPWEASSLVGSFYFTGTPTDISSAAVTSRSSYGVRVKLLDTIKSSTSIDDFKSYLERYPQGQFVALAKNRIAAMQPVTNPPRHPRGDGRWTSGINLLGFDQNSQSADDYRAYLEKYPNGEFAVWRGVDSRPWKLTRKRKLRAKRSPATSNDSKALMCSAAQW